MLQRVNMGTVPEKWKGESFPDVVAVEWTSWVPLLAAIVVFGLFPRLLLGVTQESVDAISHAFGG
jgi:NADH:ubiquinone oxidoreductase subunit 4 (subunit M)